MAEKTQGERQSHSNAHVYVATVSRRHIVFSCRLVVYVVSLFYRYDPDRQDLSCFRYVLFFRFHTVQYMVGVVDLGRDNRGDRNGVRAHL